MQGLQSPVVDQQSQQAFVLATRLTKAARIPTTSPFSGVREAAAAATAAAHPRFSIPNVRALRNSGAAEPREPSTPAPLPPYHHTMATGASTPGQISIPPPWLGAALAGTRPRARTLPLGDVLLGQAVFTRHPDLLERVLRELARDRRRRARLHVGRRRRRRTRATLLLARLLG